ncbi:MarR family transcriptional regulator [Acerihabitans sp. TG2]|uniref:MarR family winged helix-turn-helix transcriptional regulator n=1 Tax=Acerihabitans sp. TG2 TaxID=3096008 RepID=UPI002B22C266|nr:MarR family transcriptional regulator [Acerihabitans sp. TG2]MEA9393595.1 MarR family transcriptional regulator [Acerihabitans sp. TG2]
METILNSKMKNKKVSELEIALSLLQCELVARRNRFTPEAITWSQYDVLEALRVNGALRPSMISNRLGVSRTQLSKALRVLKDLDLVEQVSDDTDRRVQATRLSDQGNAFLEHAARQRQGAAQLVASVMTSGEQAIFAELCHKAVRGLQMEGIKHD